MKELLREKFRYIRSLFLSYGKVLAVSVFLLTSIVCIFYLAHKIAPRTLQVSFLDIGQGDAIFIKTPSGHTMLIDGGPSDRILEKLGEKTGYFNQRLDVMLITHPDADHITGLIPTLNKYSVSTIVTSPLLGHTEVFDILKKEIEAENAEVHTAKRGDEIIFGDGVVARVLYPSVNFHGNKNETNDASVSVLITYGNESVLLTGDLPSTHEGKLLSEALPRWVTIYKAGHHGSKYSSSEQLLSYIRPDYAVISAGKDNKYGHPNPETLHRLNVYANSILSTIEKGTITFSLDGSKAHVRTEK